MQKKLTVSTSKENQAIYINLINIDYRCSCYSSSSIVEVYNALSVDFEKNFCHKRLSF